MAGDWIKLEHATPTKPEVCLAAELLNLSRREMVGLLVDYWIWLDNNLSESCNGLVTLATRKSVEDMMHCPGFASILETMGWGTFDDKARTLTVHNWERHNGKSAKSRAMTKDRVKRSRNDAVTLAPLPEKRREDIKGLTAKPVDKSTDAQKPAQWWRDLDSIIAKGKQHGIEARPGEKRDALYKRVAAALKS